MFVIKRDGTYETINLNKITTRISVLTNKSPKLNIDVIEVVKKVVSGLTSGIKTIELDILASEICAQLITTHPDYGVLASRILVSSLHKETPKTFSEYVEKIQYQFTETFIQTVSKFKDIINSSIVNDNDYNFSYFGFKTLEKSYLLRHDNKIIERPQYLFMRVAVTIHFDNIEKILETYTLMSNKYFIHATPTLFNSGKHNQQLSSCFLTQIESDSIDGIFNTVKKCALISKSAGGIGLSVSNIRATNSKISGGGTSNGLIPMLRVFNNVARYVTQGGNKRSGSIAIYMEPWHKDIIDFLNIRKNHGKEEMRARDLFTALWVPDLFMERVKNNEMWSLFCPQDAPNLDEVWGDQFNKLYIEYENTKECTKIPAQTLWNEILSSQIETGTPYILYKDACNRTSNHNHLGTIKGSNLCQEIIQYFSKDETAVCNLASIGLPSFLENGEFNFKKLFDVVKIIVRNLDIIIDINVYPTECAKKSNTSHRPIGIGVQGLADLFIDLKYPFESLEAQKLNKWIFETIYYAALTSSCELAKEKGVYSTYNGSRISKEILHCDSYTCDKSGLWDWDNLRKNIKLYGVRNSLLVSPMPTASTSQILGFNECFEPYTSNIYTRRVLSGEFQIINTKLIKELEKIGLWNLEIKNKIIENNGSIFNCKKIPENLKLLFKTVWEIPQKTIINMAISRLPYIDQSQSLNIYMENPTFSKLSSMHFYGWSNGLKSGMYYLRSKPASKSIQFTIDPIVKEKKEIQQCNIGCESCSA